MFPPTTSELRYIKDIYDAIENKVPIDMIYPRINGGRRFTLSPTCLNDSMKNGLCLVVFQRKTHLIGQ